MKYWNDEGTYQQEHDEFYDKLVPAIGACETLAGELIRSADRIYYDAYNNGFCNNTSGALNFLSKYLLPEHKGNAALYDALSLVATKCNTGGYSDICKQTDAALDTIVDSVVIAIQANPALLTTANPCDMFSLEDEDREEENYYEEYEE